MAFQRGGSYHAGYLRGKAPNGQQALFVTEELLGLTKPQQIRVLWYSNAVNGVHGYVVNVLVDDSDSTPFFIPLKDDHRYTKLDIHAYINGLKDGLMRRASDARTRQNAKLGM